MSSECTWLMLLVLTFILAAGAQGEPVCTAHANTSKVVLVGSSVTVSCVFNKKCQKNIFRDKEQIKQEKVSGSSMMSVDVRNVTKLSIFTCKCSTDPEPCGIDITPGYPPGIPQDLACIRKTESDNVTCIWKTGRDTKITTTCHLWVQNGPDLGYRSVMNSTGFCVATFPIVGSMSQLSMRLNVSNSLGSTRSGPHNFTLSHIVKPSRPNISHVECFSRWCHLHTDNHSMNLVEVQYRAETQIWENLQTNAERSVNISSIHPYTTYTFQIRRKINHRDGLWSDWSQAKEAETQEEAPDKPLAVWYLQEPKSSQAPQSEKCFRIFWKKLSKSEANGKIQRYNISVQAQTVTSDTVDSSVMSRTICSTDCSVSVSAVNSKGQSPAKFIELRSPGLTVGIDPHVVSNNSIALFWPKLATAGHRTEYVVHWYPVGAKGKLKWIRLQDTTAHITGLRPAECYQIAVTALRSTGPVMASIEGISTWQSVPKQGPVPQLIRKESESLQVNWSKIPPEKIRGCLRKYSVYLKDKLSGEINHYSVEHRKIQFTISGLSPGQCYILWVTAWTDTGEGLKGTDLPFCTQSYSEKLMSLVILAGGVILLICLTLLCICQFSSVQRRFLSCCQCLRPTTIPDAANSKCAKKFIDQDEIKFHPDHWDSSMCEEPDTVEVEEVSHQSSFYCTYIKSFSQESSSSDATQITRSTGDYISTHGAISGGEEDEEYEEDEEDQIFDKFFPCTNSLFQEPLVATDGKLTLDVVKIDCSQFLDCM